MKQCSQVFDLNSDLSLAVTRGDNEPAELQLYKPWSPRAKYCTWLRITSTAPRNLRYSFAGILAHSTPTSQKLLASLRDGILKIYRLSNYILFSRRSCNLYGETNRFCRYRWRSSYQDQSVPQMCTIKTDLSCLISPTFVFADYAN